MTTLIPTTVGQAVKAAEEAAFLVENEEYEHYGRRLVHCRSSFFGTDWDLENVLDTIRTARDIKWHPGALLGHELLVLDAEGRKYAFDVKTPEALLPAKV